MKYIYPQGVQAKPYTTGGTPIKSYPNSPKKPSIGSRIKKGINGFIDGMEPGYLANRANEANRGKFSQFLKHKKHKNWIKGAIKHPGALHEELEVKPGKKIPTKKLASAAKKGGKLGRRARLAETLKKLKHKKVSMSKGQAVKEHEHLVKVLKTGKGLKGEAKKQGKELSEYKKLKSRKHKMLCKKYKRLHCSTCG